MPFVITHCALRKPSCASEEGTHVQTTHKVTGSIRCLQFEEWYLVGTLAQGTTTIMHPVQRGMHAYMHTQIQEHTATHRPSCLPTLVHIAGSRFGAVCIIAGVDSSVQRSQCFFAKTSSEPAARCVSCMLTGSDMGKLHHQVTQRRLYGQKYGTVCTV